MIDVQTLAQNIAYAAIYNAPLSTLERMIEDGINKIINGRSPLKEAEQREFESLWSSDCPPGYDTIVGYLSKTEPETLKGMEDVSSGTIRDGYWCTSRTREAGLPVFKVIAPLPLRERYNWMHINAYPIHIIRERFRGR